MKQCYMCDETSYIVIFVSQSDGRLQTSSKPFLFAMLAGHSEKSLFWASTDRGNYIYKELVLQLFVGFLYKSTETNIYVI